MTSPDSITVSLGWAKKLKEAGWPQEESIFYRGPEDHLIRFWVYPTEGVPGEYATPTSEEILRRLPNDLVIPYKNGGRRKRPHYSTLAMFGEGERRYFRVGYYYGKTSDNPSFRDGSLANAAAAMYCYLSVNHLL